MRAEIDVLTRERSLVMGVESKCRLAPFAIRRARFSSRSDRASVRSSKSSPFNSYKHDEQRSYRKRTKEEQPYATGRVERRGKKRMMHWKKCTPNKRLAVDSSCYKDQLKCWEG